MSVVRGAQEPTHTAGPPPPEVVHGALAALTKLASSADLTGDGDFLLAAAAEHTRATTGALAAGIVKLDDGRFVLCGFAGDPTLKPALSYPADEGTFATGAIQAGRLLRLEPDRETPAESVFTGRALLLLPLMLHGSTLGLLGVCDHGAPGASFPPEAETHLEACAAVASLILGTRSAQWDGSLRRSISTGDRDRARWAFELQAGPLQGFAAMRMALARLLRDPELTSHWATLSELDRLLGDTVREVRELITDLHPAALDNLGLVPALEAIAQRVRDRAGLQVELSARAPAARLTPEIEAAACSAVNVALSNVVMHANARKVQVFAFQQEQRLRVEVCDDGDGLPVDTAAVGESLLALRERLALVGGELELGEQPDGGVYLRAEIPVVWRVEGDGSLLS